MKDSTVIKALIGGGTGVLLVIVWLFADRYGAAWAKWLIIPQAICFIPALTVLALDALAGAEDKAYRAGRRDERAERGRWDRETQERFEATLRASGMTDHVS